MHSYFQCLSPPFVNTLLIMYTHESITGHRGLSYRHFAAFIQRFFGNNFPRRTAAIHTYISFYIHIIRTMYIYIGGIYTALRFTTVLIPTSIPHREFILYVYLMFQDINKYNNIPKRLNCHRSFYKCTRRHVTMSLYVLELYSKLRDV